MARVWPGLESVTLEYAAVDDTVDHIEGCDVLLTQVLTKPMGEKSIANSDSI